MPRKFRKKPVVIEAMQFTEDTMGQCFYWMRGKHAVATAEDGGSGPPCVDIYTLEGTMRASLGDWIIKGINGEFYPCKPDIFEKTYEPEEG